MSNTPGQQEINRTRHRGYDLIWRHDGTVAVARGDWIVCSEDSVLAAHSTVDWIIDHLDQVEGQYPVPVAARICPVFRSLTGGRAA